MENLNKNMKFFSKIKKNFRNISKKTDNNQIN